MRKRKLRLAVPNRQKRKVPLSCANCRKPGAVSPLHIQTCLTYAGTYGIKIIIYIELAYKIIPHVYCVAYPTEFAKSGFYCIAASIRVVTEIAGL